ncbi:DUF1799 domain-containing protein [Leisingera sp. M527]|uniref:DUF1799 domain-containing protein n=1 Tax=unclassified Leisingera TaxID=2614906 RepID=UPI0021A90FF4|nr:MULTISPECIES: DUF1799 domain-containing protein [unclassified Leisingera]UWQ34565.1 DUF1799 domain-containing protein [Leisingera sp. M527]UWQ73338.1 DUF1799 domain-containing protein [Leisingera sp. M658]
MQGKLFSSSPARCEEDEDAETLGIPKELMAAGRPGRTDPEGVWRQNAEAVEAFLDAATQLNRIALADGRSRITGLNYPGAQAAWAFSGTEMTPDLFAKVQMIESGVLAESSGN